jgi:hypothetical protein
MQHRGDLQPAGPGDPVVHVAQAFSHVGGLPDHVHRPVGIAGGDQLGQLAGAGDLPGVPRLPQPASTGRHTGRDRNGSCTRMPATTQGPDTDPDRAPRARQLDPGPPRHDHHGLQFRDSGVGDRPAGRRRRGHRPRRHPRFQRTGAGGTGPSVGGRPSPARSVTPTSRSSSRRPPPDPAPWVPRSRTGVCGNDPTESACFAVVHIHFTFGAEIPIAQNALRVSILPGPSASPAENADVYRRAESDGRLGAWFL